MASRNLHSESALGATVVRLPTAAPRRVKQPATVAAFRAAKDLPQHPARWVFPTVRAEIPTARHLLALSQRRTAETDALLALLQAADDVTVEKVRATLADMAAAGEETAAEALTLVRVARPMPYGTRRDIEAAMRLLGDAGGA